MAPTLDGGVISGGIPYFDGNVHDPVVTIDADGSVWVYTKEGEKLDTGVVMPQPFEDVHAAVYETLRALGLQCARAQRP